MCGIAGIVSLDGRAVPVGAVEAMNAALAHRGPDDAGLFAEDGVGLAMRRLAIIGVDNGHQPVRSEDGRCILVMNGEIYNYRDLRTELLRKGHRFATDSDVEAAVHLYEEHGADFVKHLRGMFAFALWDKVERRLVLGRDRAGKKPLYYAIRDGRLLFSSEIKSLHASGCLPKELDPGGLRSYLVHGFTLGEGTLFAGVRKLGAASTLVARGEHVAVSRYWDLDPVPEFQGTLPEAAAHVRDLLDEAVRLRLMSEVPLGAFLSGGLDSTAVVSVMARHLSRPVQTFAVGFDAHGLDELVHAREAARALKTDHRELVVRDCPPALLQEINWYNDEPAADPATVPTYCLARFAREHVKVVLTGEGGDESFGGYRHYALSHRMESLAATLPGLDKLARLALVLEDGFGDLVPRRLWKGAWLASLTGEDRLHGWLSAFTRKELDQLLAPLTASGRATEPSLDWLRGRAGQGGADELTRSLMYLDSRHSLADGLLMKVDKMTMATALEARCPLLDQKLVEFAWTLPLAMKFGNGETKRVFREAVRDLIPATLLARPKQGFDVPLRRWLLGDLAPLVSTLLLDERAGIGRYVGVARVQQMFAGLKRRNDVLLARQLWRLLNLAVWHEQHWPGNGARAGLEPSSAGAPRFLEGCTATGS